MSQEKAMRMAEIERKRMELRRRMEEASKARRAKKSFMTPERKKKLRLLLRRKAAEELKKEQERKAEERRWTIEERCGEPEDMEWASKEDLIDICEYYYQRILEIESEKWDIELDIRRKHFEIVDINSKVNDLRGKFQRPILKKVSKYENRFAKLQRKAAEFNFRNQLKLVRRHEFMLKDDDKKGHHADKRFRLPRMSARCASCHYPLSVCDSVACIECDSHFHIDCAQLVGFPLFGLSAEPSKNIFHCSTCKLLPLPQPRGDSDTSDDEGMPSRQPDFSLEGDNDCGKDMNEVKGTIQDLSDLCKDMLREINDLKSINLTLRCCIENLRHDNEQRDDVISELRRRLDLLEERTLKGNIVETFDQLSSKEDKTAMCLKNKTESIQLDINESLIENTTYSQTSAAYKQELFSNYTTTSKEETEGYELEENSPSIDINETLMKSTSYGQKSAAYKKELYSNYTTTSKEETEGYELEETSSFLEKEEESQRNKLDSENKQRDDAEIGYSGDETDNEDENEIKTIDEAKELVKAEIVSETNENRQDWSWKGSDAVEVSKKDDKDEEEEEESEEDDSEEESPSVIIESPSWLKLKEEIESAIREDDNAESSVEIEAIDTEEKEDPWKVRKSVRWDENIEDESDTEVELSQRDHKHEEQSEVGTETLADDDLTSVDDVGSVTEVDDRFEADEGLRLDSRASGIEEEHLLEADEVFAEERTILEASEELAGDESRLEDAAAAEEESHIEGEVTAEGELRLEGNVSVDGEPRLEGNVSVDGEPRLEGDLTVEGEPMLEGEATVDGESRLEGDIIDRELRQDDEATAEGDLRLEGEVVPDDEDILPPDSPEPVHTEEDLWLYLKENVSSEHPSTVEEFVRNLIGTLQHVPEEYLKPVIDANIKRANSPSVTDGEHPPSPEGVRPEEGTSNVNPLETSDSPSGASTQEVSSEFPGVSSAVEATD